jgi:hypothetical protein
MNKIALALLVTVASVQAQARLVIIQDDQVIKKLRHDKEMAIAEDIIERKKSQIAFEKKAQEKSVVDSVNAEKPRYDQSDYIVIADRTEKIITHFGAVPKNLPAVGGGGIDTPFWLSMNSIVPDGWKVLLDKTVDPQQKVNWSGYSANWVAVTYRLGVEKDLVFDLNWNNREVIVHRRVSVTDNLKKKYLSR